ncbi:MAG TPA: glycosyltransferase family 39 protein [Chloroflexota bacterium]|nr:glycosyltransferase family 39 protein [Chloroflexota bacterium]
MTTYQRTAEAPARRRASRGGKRGERRASAPVAAPRAAGALARRLWWAGLGGVLAVAVLLRLPGLDGPIGGFHAFNEAHYILMAQNVLQGWILDPTSDQTAVFLDKPPLLAYLLALPFAVGGPSILVARLVALLISVLLVGAVGLLGRELYDAETGLAAGAMMATAPIAVIAGRNVQTDALYLLLTVAALWCYYRADYARPVANRLLAGALFGLAIFAKLFAALAVVAAAVWDLLVHGARPLRDRWRWLAALLVVLPSGLFYAYHALRDYRYFVSDVFGGAAVATTVPTTAAAWGVLVSEAWWACAPSLAVLILAGVIVALARPRPPTLYLLLPLLLYAAFYVYAHKHSYYMLFLLPFGTILAAAALGRLPWRAARVAIVVAACGYAAFVTLVDYPAMKLGFQEWAEASARLNGGEGLRIILDPDVAVNAGPVARLYLGRAELVENGRAAGPPPPGGVYRLSYAVPGPTAPADAQLFSMERHGLLAFGWLIADDHVVGPHFFHQGRYFVERVGGLLDFGFPVIRPYPILRLTPVR